MALIISSDLQTKIRDEANMADPMECCGLLMGQGHVVSDIVPAANVSKTPRTHFEIDPAILIEAIKAERAGGPAILGYYHSHPSSDNQPSVTDAAMAAADGKYWVIIANLGLKAFRASQNGAMHGRFDAVELNSRA